MGLRMFVEPDAVESKTAAKADPTAPARSTIRRQRTVRYSPGIPSNHHDSSTLYPRRQHHGSNIAGHVTERRSLLEDIRRRGGNSRGQTSHGPLTSDIRDLEAAVERYHSQNSNVLDVVAREATHGTRMEIEGASASESINHSHQAGPMPRRDSFSGNIRRESNTRLMDEVTDNEYALRSLGRRSQAPRSTPTPPFESQRSHEQNLAQTSSQRFGRAAYTPGFPPAHRLHRIDPTLGYSERVVEIASLANQVRELGLLADPQNDRLELDEMSSDLSAMMVRDSSDLSYDYLAREHDCMISIRDQLGRIRLRAVRILAASQSRDIDSAGALASLRARRGLHSVSMHHDDMDGLGDRERSFSPDAVSWETMLTTISPDDQVPSTHSSFNTATTASASSVSTGPSSSASSSTTQSSTFEIDSCPTAESSGSDRGEQDNEVAHSTSSPSNPASREFLSRANGHLDRIESLSRRLRQQRAQGEFAARHRRIIEREAELQRLEMTLHRLERQLEEERTIHPSWQGSTGVRAGRGRL